ncbi:hypothetical protein CH273_25795 [Rhodococcus sp. 05-339-2]|uniref:hypothetical protein n=1 Tax=Rhodococcoides fascians TaxID=1828 RepID=UPI00050CF7D9|nr:MULTISPECIES: hypothetical protein [Rhodococcus]OZD74902.1 hypothetical protein CH273_25795 [Rhodococcus sp. 05-339-2]
MSAYLPEGSTLDDGGKYDAGHGMHYTPYYRDEACTQLDGIWFWHPCANELATPRGPHPGPNGRTNENWDYTNRHTPDRLTIRASILCDCGFHGFLTNGRWEPC